MYRFAAWKDAHVCQCRYALGQDQQMIFGMVNKNVDFERVNIVWNEKCERCILQAPKTKLFVSIFQISECDPVDSGPHHFNTKSCGRSARQLLSYLKKMLPYLDALENGAEEQKVGVRGISL